MQKWCRCIPWSTTQVLFAVTSSLALPLWLLWIFFAQTWQRPLRRAARLSGGEQPPVLPLSHMGHFSALPGLENKKRDRRQRAGQGPSPHPIPQHLGGVWGWGRQPGSNNSPPGHRGRVPPNPSRPGTWGLREATPKEHHGAEGGRYRQPQLIFPPFPLSLEEILFQGRSKGASDLCRGRLAAL